MILRSKKITLKLEFIQSKVFFSTDTTENFKKNREWDILCFSIPEFYNISARIIDDLNAFFIKNNVFNLLKNAQMAPFEGMFESDARNAVFILNLLMELKKQFNDTFVISAKQLASILESLVSTHHLTVEQEVDYFKNIPSEITLEDRMQDALENNEFETSLYLAQHFSTIEAFNEKYVLNWLMNANRFFDKSKQESEEFEEFIVPASLLACVTCLSTPIIFSNDHVNLLQQFSKGGYITRVKIDLCHTNKNFGNFLQATPSLKELNLTKTPSNERIAENNISDLIYVLSNPSIKTVLLNNQPIGNMGLKVLLDELEDYQTSLKKLDLSSCQITNEGAKTILRFLDHLQYENKKLPQIILEGNMIDAELGKEIYQMTGQLKISHEIADQDNTHHNDNNNNTIKLEM